MKFKEIKDWSPPEKQKKLVELKKEMMKFKTIASTGTSPENAGRIKQIRKDIARILTSIPKQNE